MSSAVSVPHTPAAPPPVTPAAAAAARVAAAKPSPVQQAADDFASKLAAATGLDINVIRAWMKVEGAYDSGGTGHYNFLNLRPAASGASYSGAPIVGTSSGNFQEFASVDAAVQETAYWINNFSNYSGIRGSVGQAPNVQIAAIAASPWDAGHYSGGSSLLSAYHSITGGGGSLLGKVGGAISSGYHWYDTHLGYGQPSIVHAGDAITGAASTAAAVITGPADAIKWLWNQNNLIRVGYVLGGAVLVAIGLLELARSVGAVSYSAPSPLVVPLGGGSSGPRSPQTSRQGGAGFKSEGTKAAREAAADHDASFGDVPF